MDIIIIYGAIAVMWFFAILYKRKGDREEREFQEKLNREHGEENKALNSFLNRKK